MYINVEIVGSKKEIEDYLKIKFGAKFSENSAKSLSKILKKETSIVSAQCETGICTKDVPKYTIKFAHYGVCVPKKYKKYKK